MSQNTPPTDENAETGSAEPKRSPKTTPPAFVNQRPPVQTMTNYRKKQQVGPFVIWTLVVVLIVGGLVIRGHLVVRRGRPGTNHAGNRNPYRYAYLHPDQHRHPDQHAD